jgi:DNA repair exonuclease SbcCD ATPase subunit
MDDWLKRLATEPAKGLETTRSQLRELRTQQRTEALADQVAQAAQDRQEGRPEQARQAEQDAAQRFQEMAKSLEQEHQRLVRSHLEQLAAAENDAKTLQSELTRQAQQSEPAPPETTERLRELANQLQDLRDAPLDKTARELREQLPPQPPPGAPPQGTKVPDRIRQETLPASVTRLRTLIDAVVQRELLVDRDSRIPEQYSGLVESYFKALSDDQK